MKPALFPYLITALSSAEFTPPATLAESLHSRLAVHRQTVRHALLETLRASYPAIERAVGSEYFRAVAAEFIACSPPRTPVLQEYGSEFPEFLQKFPPLQAWPWLADLAQLDWTRQIVTHAADATALTPQTLAALPEAGLLQARLRLHPALRWLISPYPIDQLWLRQDEEHHGPELQWQPVSLQVWRPDAQVMQRRLQPGEAQLRQGLRAGARLIDALQSARQAAPEFDPDTALAALFTERLIVGVDTFTQRNKQ
ncbi:MAG: putative DNA-binding domain-containing protein [Rhodanobacteraceae bacterium]|nr:putative DNA-binding domain-containing protein [Rhodanobacteraceae bacterium]